MASFFSRLSYSLCNEDWRTERKALQIQPNHRVVCITASGDRPLHLLLNQCAEMVAIDANPVQNHLLELKKIAMSKLNYDDYLAFLGLTTCSHRLSFFNQMISELPLSAAYWTKHAKKIHKGIIYQGATEKWIRRVSFLIRFLRRREINTLFKMENLEDQRSFLKSSWNHKLWKKACNIGINPWISSLFFKDPGTYANYDKSIKPGAYAYDRLVECLNHNLAKENLLISLIFQGSISKEAYPPYLQKQGVETIKQNLHKLTIKTADIIKFLESEPDKSIDRFSLSDVASYIDYDTYLRLLQEIYRTARPGARFCLRQFISRYQIPTSMQSWFERDTALEKTLEKEDSAFVYHFTVGTVIKK